MMDIMVSGLTETECQLLIGEGEQAWRWCAASAFLSDGTHDGTVQRVWMYRAPWALGGAGPQAVEDCLTQWLVEQRGVLRRRKSFGRQVLLVNADRVVPTALRGELGLEPRGARDGLVDADKDCDWEEVAVAKLFEWIAPQYWDVFEALEAASWPSKDEPVFRHSLPVLGESALWELVRRLRDARSLPVALSELGALRAAVESERKAGREALARVREERNALVEEIERLRDEREEVTRSVTEALEGKGALAREVEVSNKAVAELRVSLEKRAVELSDLRSENDRLVRQLHHAQEEREGRAGQLRDMKAQLGREGELLTSEIEGLKAETLRLQKSLVDAQQARERLSRELDKHRKVVKESSERATRIDRERDELAKDSELLLLQLHQVQEELEEYHLKNRELADELERTRAANVPSAVSDAAGKAAPLTAPGGTDADPVGRGTERGSFLALVRGPTRKIFSKSKARKILEAQMSLVELSGLFDRKWYLEAYPDVRNAGIDPIEHYLKFGWKELRNPGAGFDTLYYLSANPDVAKSGHNPLVHYIKFGRAEGRPAR